MAVFDLTLPAVPTPVLIPADVAPTVPGVTVLVKTKLVIVKRPKA